MTNKRRRKNKIAWAMQAFTSTVSVTLLLILMGLIVLLSLTARVVADSVKENLTVTVVLEDDVQTPDAQHLCDSLNRMYYVSSIDYISREQALQEQIESMGIDPTEFLGANPFSISMEIRMKPEYSCNDSLEWIAGELESSKLVADVVYQKDLVESLNFNLHRASLFMLAIALLLVIISLLLIGCRRSGIFLTILVVLDIRLNCGFLRIFFVFLSIRLSLRTSLVFLIRLVI